MIKVTMLRHEGDPRGFILNGHAGYAEEGSDIVCSAVTALTMAAVNGLTEAAGIQANVVDDGKTLTCTIPAGLSVQQLHDAKLLMDTYGMTLSEIRKDYKQYLKIYDREV